MQTSAPFRVQKILFDLDGTLVDSAPDLHAATNHVMDHVGRPLLKLDQVRHMVGQGAKKLIELGLNATGGSENHNIDDLLPVFLDYYRSNIANGTYFYDGALELIKALKAKGLGVAICTNKPIGLANILLHELGAHGLFDVITGGDSFAFKKPDPKHIIATADMMEGDGECLMVGDTFNDIDAAKAANIPSIAVSFGYSATPATELGADITVDHLIDILKYIE
ncbi:phosphoglycolate phosphatase [Kordiimonas sp. SCSIO 12610]|uniref:phosphoglycolate phosphatase n=1 Tax=Kordiimonas sp. SCSIO 12610 TaxID=2829597 RepID=UPI00210B1DE4|nr:phosphoglycolate phosphatase [Kordiimonas sp. SCSIO 12610]UTW54138.1 phosphoglycolate phosphatase [Kordiimonas sp. SCSIO 12610]